MSEKILRLLLDELTTVRLLCQNKGCGGVVEYPLERLRGKFQFANACPLCGTEFGGSGSPIYDLAAAIDRVKDMGERVKVEFILADPE